MKVKMILIGGKNLKPPKTKYQKLKHFEKGKSDIGGAWKWQVFVLGVWVFQNFFFGFSPWKNQLGIFFSALIMDSFFRILN